MIILWIKSNFITLIASSQINLTNSPIREHAELNHQNLRPLDRFIYLFMVVHNASNQVREGKKDFHIDRLGQYNRINYIARIMPVMRCVHPAVSKSIKSLAKSCINVTLKQYSNFIPIKLFPRRNSKERRKDNGLSL